MTTNSPPLSDDDAVRVAIGDPNGYRSGTWRIWFGPQDIFAGYRSMANIRKASVHYPRPGLPGHEETVRYIGYTREYGEKHSLPTGLDQRAEHSWPGHEFAPHYFVEFRVRIPRTELRRFTLSDSHNTHWLTAPSAREATEIAIISGPPWHQGLAPRMSGGSPTELLADFKLPNGRYVWIMHYTIPAPSGSDMQRVRARAKEEWLEWQRNGMVAQLLPKTRIGAVTNCGDGSFAEIELAADFLRGPKRRRA